MPVFSTVPYQTPEDEYDASFGASLADAARQPSTADDNDSAAPLPVMAPAAPAAPMAPAAGGGGLVPAPAPIAPPVYTDPDRSKLQDWENRRVQDSAVSTGPAVSPKWWERALGGVASGAMAFGHVPGAVEGGQNITNRRFNQAENERAGRLDADQAGIQAEQGNINAQQNQWEQGLKQFNANVSARSRAQLDADRQAQEQARRQAIAPGSEAPDDPNNPLGAWHATTVGGQRIATQPSEKWLKSTDGVRATRHAELEDLKQGGHKLSPEQETFYLANGKLHEPVANTNIHIPSAESQAYNDTLSAWKSDNPGKKPTMEDMRNIRAAAGGREVTGKGSGRGPGGRGTPQQFKTLDSQTSLAYKKAEDKYKADLSIAETPEDRQVAKDSLEQEKQRIATTNSDQLRDLGGVPAEDGQPKPKTPAAPSAPAPKTAPAPVTNKQVFNIKGQQLKVGDPVNIPGGKGIFMGINPQTKKPIIQRK